MEKSSKNNKTISYRCLTLVAVMIITPPYINLSACLAANSDSDLNFKIYNPESPAQSNSQPTEESSSTVSGDQPSAKPAKSSPESDSVDLRSEMPLSADTPIAPKLDPSPSSSNANTDTKEAAPASSPAGADIGTGDTGALRPEQPTGDSAAPLIQPITQPANSSAQNTDKPLNQADGKTDEITPNTSSDQTTASTDTTSGASTSKSDTDNKGDNNKVLQGYVRVVPSGTKIPIIMDTAVDSDTSQEGDEFSARTSEDLTIDGTTVVPAGSIIKGRIATLNAPRHMIRSGSVALKFDTVTTPDNRQIPLVANLVARGGVVHAKRGLKDVAIDAGVFSLPTAIGLGIGVIAGHSNSSSSIGTGGAALIGAGVGAAVGLAVLLAKKGKKVDVRPGDELKIELAEDLHMPTM